MSFIAVPVASGSPTAGFSTPNRASFCVQDDGSGGQILVNGLGINAPTVSFAVDLKTLFGAAAWHSRPLLRAFQNCASLEAVNNQINTWLNFSSVFINGVGVAGALGITPLLVSGYMFLGIAGPSVAGIWRVDLQLRHSIPG